MEDEEYGRFKCQKAEAHQLTQSIKNKREGLWTLIRGINQEV